MVGVLVPVVVLVQPQEAKIRLAIREGKKMEPLELRWNSKDLAMGELLLVASMVMVMVMVKELRELSHCYLVNVWRERQRPLYERAGRIAGYGEGPQWGDSH